MKVLPVLILLGLLLLSLGIEIERHGKPKVAVGVHSAWPTFIALIIDLLLYWWAGMFQVFGL